MKREGDAFYEDSDIQLNEYKDDSAGRVTNLQIMHLWDRISSSLADFTTEFFFNTSTLSEAPYGDGMTFFLAPPNYTFDKNQTLEVQLGIGLAQNHRDQFVAVEFDTVYNDAF